MPPLITHPQIFCLLLLSLLPTASTSPQQPSSRVLEPGQTVTASFRPLEAAETPMEHSYSFAGAKGEYVEVRVEQEGCDVRLHILGPDGQEIATSDSYNGGYGPECWRGILTQPGRHQVRVEYISIRGKDATYQIALSARRTATEVDHRRAQAQEIYIQAWKQRQSGEERDAEQAYYLYDKAAELYREAGDTLGEAQSLESAAALGTPVLSIRLRIDLYQRALSLFRRLRERSSEGTTLHNLGAIYADLNRPGEAIAFYQQALAAHRDVGNRYCEAIALNNLGLVYCGLNQVQEALGYFQQALAICRQIGDRASEASLLKYIGETYEELGQPGEAARYYRQSEEIKNK